MKRILRLIGLTVAAAAIFASVIAPAPAAAAGISAEPTYGNFETTFSFEANGFQRNEIVDTWVTVPNGESIGTGTLTADEDGVVEWTFAPQTSYGGGEYIAVAHGRGSGEHAVKFVVVAPSNAQPEPSDNEDEDTDSKPVPIAPLSERTAYFTGRGFQAGEVVATWYTAPNGESVTYKNMTADAWGNLEFPFVLGPGWMYGSYNLVGHGMTSKNTEYVTFSWFGTVTDARASKPVVTPSPRFDFAQGGFTPNGIVSVWITLPNGKSESLTLTRADGNGNLYYRVNIPPSYLYGGYLVAAYDWKTGVTKWQRFSYFGEVNRMYP